MKKAIDNLSESVSKSPILAMMLIIFLVQSYIMVIKLDKINETLISIHKDNILIQQYTSNESADTKVFITRLEEVEQKLAMVWELSKK